MEIVPFQDMPPRLRPTVSSTRNGVFYTYSNLAKTHLTVEEREWLVRETLGETPAHPDQVRRQCDLLRRYGLYSTFFQKNIAIYKKEGRLREVGRPDLIDEEHMCEVVRTLIQRRREVNEVPKSELQDLLTDATIKTELSRGRVNPSFEKLDERTEARYCELYHIKETNSQAVTKARVDACKCPMMSYVWYLICVALGNDLPSHRKWNADATTFVFEPPGAGGKTVRLVDEEEYKYIDESEVVLKHPQPGKCQTKSSRLGFAIKVMQLINAAGENSDFVCIIAIKQMPPQSWHVEVVPGLSMSSHIGAKGILYFTHTRCGTADMWRDYFLRVVIPSIHQSNVFYKSCESPECPTRNFFSTDGEDIIISNAYDESLANEFEEAGIDYGRVGASTTAIHNACDRQVLFREAKKKVKRVLSSNTDFSNISLEASLRTSFEHMAAAHPSVSLTADAKSTYMEGLCCLVHVFSTVMNPTMVRRGFTCCGQDCPANENGSTIDFHKMMYQCYSDISQDQLQLMQDQAPMLVDIIKREGRITYQQLIDAGIKPGTTTINRDDLTHVRHWSEIITHEKTRERFRQEIVAKDPAVKERKKAEEFIRKDAEKKELQRVRDEEKEQKKRDAAYQREIFRSMTPAEQKAHKEQEREAKKQKKDERDRVNLEKQRAYDEELKRALEIVNAAV